MTERITLTDIAAAVGVSKATVSLALNGNPRISEKTRRRIERTAAELGYRPDPALASLASYRWEERRGKSGINLALLTDQQDFSDNIVPGVRAEAQQLGYNLALLECASFSDSRELSRVLVQRGVQGVVMSIKTPGWLEEFDWSAFAVVNAGHAELPVALHHVRADSFESVCGAWRKVRALGYRRIGIAIFHSSLLQAVSMQRLAAADWVLHRLKRDGDAVSVYASPFVDLAMEGAGDVIAAFGDWIREFEPDVVIGTNGIVYWYLNQLGLRVPDHVALALVRRGSQAPGSCPIELAGMSCDEQLLGRRMVNELDLMIKRGEKGPPAHPHATILPPCWVDGASCPPKAADEACFC